MTTTCIRCGAQYLNMPYALCIPCWRETGVREAIAKESESVGRAGGNCIAGSPRATNRNEKTMADPITETIDFGGAVLLMRAGIPVRRLGWASKKPVDRKYQIEIIDDQYGQRFKTTFLNYQSDRAVLSSEDLLAKDWIEVEP